jgi:hypothetical protein
MLCCLLHRLDDSVDPAANSCGHLAADARKDGPNDDGKALTTLELDIAYGANAASVWCRPSIRGLVRLPAMATRPICSLSHLIQATTCQACRSRVDMSI